jgi:ribose transport system permease protein
VNGGGGTGSARRQFRFLSYNVGVCLRDDCIARMEAALPVSQNSLAVMTCRGPAGRLADVVRTAVVRVGILPVFLVVLAAIGWKAPALFDGNNISLVLRESSIVGTMAIGATFVMVAGRIDLSIGSLLTLASYIAINLHENLGPAAAVAAVLALSAGVGVINGFIVGYLGLNPLIATLAMMSLLQGLTLVYGAGANVYVSHPDATWFAVFGRGYLVGVPVPVLILGGLAVSLGVLLHLTPFGRRTYAVGGNAVASSYAGLNVRRTVALAYILGGLTTGVAALIIASRVMGAQVNTGDGYQFSVISAVVLGGTSFLGGSGTIAGTVVGVVLLAFMQNGLLLLGLPYYIQWIVTWAVIIFAVWAELSAKRKRLFT